MLRETLPQGRGQAGSKISQNERLILIAPLPPPTGPPSLVMLLPPMASSSPPSSLTPGPAPATGTSGTPLRGPRHRPEAPGPSRHLPHCVLQPNPSSPPTPPAPHRHPDSSGIGESDRRGGIPKKGTKVEHQPAEGKPTEPIKRFASNGERTGGMTGKTVQNRGGRQYTYSWHCHKEGRKRKLAEKALESGRKVFENDAQETFPSINGGLNGRFSPHRPAEERPVGPRIQSSGCFSH